MSLSNLMGLLQQYASPGASNTWNVEQISNRCRKRLRSNIWQSDGRKPFVRTNTSLSQTQHAIKHFKRRAAGRHSQPLAQFSGRALHRMVLGDLT